MRQIIPSVPASMKLFATGATVGSVVDSLHNQSLLRYDLVPILIGASSSTTTTIDTITAASGSAEGTTIASSYLFASSWVVPPLLGTAYLVLGGVLPRLLLAATTTNPEVSSTLTSSKQQQYLLNKAALAVFSTALIIRLSEFLQTSSSVSGTTVTTTTGTTNLIILAVVAITQWFLLDGTWVALTIGTLAGIFGPLAELPFVAAGFWHYIPSAADYFPLQNVALFSSSSSGTIQDLALSSITGPCYFAVTMDAIALGRYFDSTNDDNDNDDNVVVNDGGSE